MAPEVNSHALVFRFVQSRETVQPEMAAGGAHLSVGSHQKWNVAGVFPGVYWRPWCWYIVLSLPTAL